MNKKELAEKLHKKGYNCAQSVACAFCEEVNLPEELLFKLNEGFGFGFGCGKSACGALSAAIMLLGLKHSTANLSAPNSKAATYKIGAAFTEVFKSRTGSIICEEIKGSKNGKPLCLCDKCISIGVEIFEEYLRALEKA